MPYQSNVRKTEDGDNMSVSFDSTHFDHQSGSYYTRPSSLLPNGSVNVTEDDVAPVRDYYQASAQDSHFLQMFSCLVILMGALSPSSQTCRHVQRKLVIKRLLSLKVLIQRFFRGRIEYNMILIQRYLKIMSQLLNCVLSELVLLMKVRF